MDALDFIQKDLKRQPATPVPAAVLALGAAGLPILLGLLLRADLVGVTDPRIFVPNLIAAGLLAGAALLTRRRTPAAISGAILLLILAALLASERAVFPPGGVRNGFPSTEVFWQATVACFTKGAVSSAILGAWLGIFAFAFAPWPSRRGRAVLAFGSGVSGAVMLGFHCDSSSWGHVLIGHLGQGLLAGLLLFFAFELVFRSGLRAALPELLGRIKDSGRIG